MARSISHLLASQEPRLRLDALPFRPAVRRWARALVRASPPRSAPEDAPGLLALFIDGLPTQTLATHAGRELRFLGALRDARSFHETRCFSGIPSTTTAFQAGLFYGLRHPDVPAFTWFDRKDGRLLRMNKPREAAQVEDRLIATAAGGVGLMAGGTSYLSILHAGGSGHFSTAGIFELLSQPLVRPAAAERRGTLAKLHRQTIVELIARLATETPQLACDVARFGLRTGSNRGEGNYVLNRLLVGTVLQEIAMRHVIADLLDGVPRVFLGLADFDEVSHRRGPVQAAHETLRRIDHVIECLFAICALLPQRRDVFIFTDHGQLPATPFEHLFGHRLEAWLLGAGDGANGPPSVPRVITEFLERSPGRPSPKGAALRVVEAGNYAHVYFGRERALVGAELLGENATTLARALACPGIGLTAVRTRDGAAAFHRGRPVDLSDPSTIPKGTSAHAIEALLAELPRSPSSGDLVLYGAWHPGGCIAFPWEFSSHGGLSPAETDTFVLHPADLEDALGPIEHGADFHQFFRERYG